MLELVPELAIRFMGTARPENSQNPKTGGRLSSSFYVSMV